MAFIEYRTKGGGGSDPTPIEPVEGKRGLTVSQWLSNSGSNQFGFLMESWLGLSWENVVKRWFNKEAPFETLYSDIYQLCADIMAWYYIRQPDWNKMKEALEAQYNPIENYDRTRTGTESDVQGYVNTSGSGNGSDGSSSGTTEKVAPYDSATFLNNSQTNIVSNASYNTSSNTNQITNMKTTVNVRDHGNVGVTTNQQMIEAELALRYSYLVGIIIREFKKEFCVCLYN